MRMLIAISFSLILIITGCSDRQIEKNKQQKSTVEQVEKEDKTVQATPDNIKSAVFKTLGFNAVEGEQKITDVVIGNEDEIIIKFIPDANGGEHLLSFTIQKDIANILSGIKDSNIMVKSVQLIAIQSTVDQSGTNLQKEMVNVSYGNETINKIDFESFNTDDILSMADEVIYLDSTLGVK